MRPESLKHLEDIRVAARFILDHVGDRSLADYMADELLRPATERNFEIIGEALNRLRRCDPRSLDSITDHAQIIAFRNVLIHGYDAIDHRRVWDAIQNSLPVLLQEVLQMLRTGESGA